MPSLKDSMSCAFSLGRARTVAYVLSQRNRGSSRCGWAQQATDLCARPLLPANKSHWISSQMATSKSSEEPLSSYYLQLCTLDLVWAKSFHPLKGGGDDAVPIEVAIWWSLMWRGESVDVVDVKSFSFVFWRGLYCWVMLIQYYKHFSERGLGRTNMSCREAWEIGSDLCLGV